MCSSERTRARREAWRRLMTDEFLIVVHGGSEDIKCAREVLVAAGSADVLTHPGTV